MINYDIDQISEKLKTEKEFRILYHKRPDGDTICCSFALALALRLIGARCEVAGSDSIPDIYRYMTDRFPNDTVVSPITVSVDASAPNRLGSLQNERIDICIDHHMNNTIDAPLKLVDSEAAACAEVLYTLLLNMNIEISKDIANLLYTAIVTDSNCFRSRDLRPETMHIAAALAYLGADISAIARRHYLTKSPKRIAIENILFSSFRYFCGEKVVCGTIKLSDLDKAGIKDNELEGINSLVEQIEGAEIGVVIRELPDGRSRISVRTSDNYSADKICAKIGGGGHEHAAGAELDESPDEAISIMKKICTDAITEK